MPKASTSRPPLPTSSSDFALPSSSNPGSSALSLDDPGALFQRFRRPSLLQKAGYISDSRTHSPLASSFSFHGRRRSRTEFMPEESESDKDRMMTDSPSGSETHTPPLKVAGGEEDLAAVKPAPSKPPPSTPPRRRQSTSMDAADMPTIFNRRLSFPVKQHRILTLLAEEARPEEAEVKSEAAFQRLVASVSDLPAQPRTPRTFVDRGRYPEEAGQEEEFTREETPSDDEGETAPPPATEEGPFAFSAPPTTGTQPIPIQRPASRTITPVGSVAGSVNGDEMGMSMSETSSNFGGAAMDIDMPLGSPVISSMSLSSINQWRYTPPPSSHDRFNQYNTVRSNKRKLDERFDPYPNSSKRRAVSPSISYLRDSHSSVNGSPITRGASSRIPIALPITIPTSTASSCTNSPTIGNQYPPFPRGLNITSSPTLRPTLMMASPILRPLGRRRHGEGEDEREIQGAGEAVNGLTLGPRLVSTPTDSGPPTAIPHNLR
ncbi:hypothetical protein CPB83DRAFT_869791 [Crepidotus variabilis]|uniref:Uncharacterized protein n=1 Tax=Crepidotus variabilis TaxID=179855 RepID=A0A9P6EEV7_9AGAR|nr:hypothetical protein CPB83DRAFT_869791 [Crepidotus variabilis]